MAVNSFREDEQVVSQGKWKVIVRLLAYLKNYKLGVAGVLLCMMATVAISLINPLLIEAAIDNYIEKISNGAKYLKKVNSEIKTSLDKIIQFMSIAIIPIGIIFFINQYGIQGNSITMAVVNTVAAVIGMIPEGLVLLVSSVLAVATIRLARKKVLVQQSYCIENLARVDTICFDKTNSPVSLLRY